MIKVKFKVDVDLRAVSKQTSDEKRMAKPVNHRGKVPRVSRLMAISIQFDRMLRSHARCDSWRRR